MAYRRKLAEAKTGCGNDGELTPGKEKKKSDTLSDNYQSHYEWYFTQILDWSQKQIDVKWYKEFLNRSPPTNKEGGSGSLA